MKLSWIIVAVILMLFYVSVAVQLREAPILKPLKHDPQKKVILVDMSTSQVKGRNRNLHRVL